MRVVRVVFCMQALQFAYSILFSHSRTLSSSFFFFFFVFSLAYLLNYHLCQIQHAGVRVNGGGCQRIGRLRYIVN